MAGSGAGIGTVWGASSLAMLGTLSEQQLFGSWLCPLRDHGILLPNGGLSHCLQHAKQLSPSPAFPTSPSRALFLNLLKYGESRAQGLTERSQASSVLIRNEEAWAEMAQGG